MKFICATALVFVTLMLGLCSASSLKLKLRMQRIESVTNGKKKVLTTVSVNKADGCFTVEEHEWDNNKDFKGKYQITQIETANTNRIKLTTKNTDTGKEQRFYVKYQKEGGTEFMDWLSKSANEQSSIGVQTAPFVKNYTQMRQDSLKMYMDKKTEKGIMQMVLNFKDAKQRDLKNLDVTMPTTKDGTKYYSGWRPKDKSTITRVFHPSSFYVSNNCTTSVPTFKVEVTDKDNNKYYRKIRAYHSDKKTLQDTTKFLLALYRFKKEVFDSEWSTNPLYKVLFNLPMNLQFPTKGAQTVTIGRRLAEAERQ